MTNPNKEASAEVVAFRHPHEDGWEYYDYPTGHDCMECQALVPLDSLLAEQEKVQELEAKLEDAESRFSAMLAVEKKLRDELEIANEGLTVAYMSGKHDGRKLEAKEAEPVATGSNPPYSNCSFNICDLPGQCVGEGSCHHPRGGNTLPSQPTPLIQAAVSAALRKAGEEIKHVEAWQQEAVDRILSIPNDDTALRELLAQVADEIYAAVTTGYCDKESIIDRVLRGE